MGDRRRQFHVDPELVIQEAMYGFIMALTLVTTARLGIFTYASRTDLILAIVGMDFVWGIIDMYIFFRGDLLAHRRRLQTYLDMASASSIGEKKRYLVDEFHGTIFELASESDRDKLMEVFIGSEFVEETTLRHSTFNYALNAVTAFLVTMLTVVPSVLALMTFEDYSTALLCSSLISSIALFFTGYFMAPGVSIRSRVLTGGITVCVALFFTILAAYLGG